MAEKIIKVQIEPLAEGGYLATSDDLSGLVAQGRTVAEMMEIAQDVRRKLIESYLEHGDALPPSLRNVPKRVFSLELPAPPRPAVRLILNTEEKLRCKKWLKIFSGF